MSPRSTCLQSYDGPIATETGLSLDSGNWPGFRRCYRRSTVHHAVENLRCDCLRVEIPVEAQAKGSGRLATDFERMARGGRVARASECIEEAIPGFMKAWKAADRRERRAARRVGRPS